MFTMQSVCVCVCVCARSGVVGSPEKNGTVKIRLARNFRVGLGSGLGNIFSRALIFCSAVLFSAVLLRQMF